MKNTSGSEGRLRLAAFFDTLESELLEQDLTRYTASKAVERQFDRARKRAALGDASLSAKAIASFKLTNELVAKTEVRMSEFDINNAKYFITVALERYTAQFTDIPQEVLYMQEIFDSWRFGPGASIGIKGTHAVEKMYQPFTCTTLVEPLVLRLRRTHPYLSAMDCANSDSGVVLVSGSRLTTVPKNETTDRTIAIEPLGNMALQLAAGRYLEGVLRRIGLDIRTQQPKNKALARVGSIDGSFATIDMKSASDMMSINLVRLLLPPEWFELLMKLRSPTIELPGGEIVNPSMISTMGNGFTFPLMTLIFTSLIYAYRCRHGGPNLYIDWNHTAVFGDDVIVKTHEYVGIVELIEQAGFVVNTDKSYFVGTFRESCGGDYDAGADITPFYVKKLTSDAHVYIAINQLLDWSARHDLWMPRSYRLLLSFLHGEKMLVPEWEDDFSGIRTQVAPRKYSRLKLKHWRKRVKNIDTSYLMPLLCGGYIESHGLDFVYSPRNDHPEYKVKRNARIPSGFLDGSDPLTRTAIVSSRVALIVTLL